MEGKDEYEQGGPAGRPYRDVLRAGGSCFLALAFVARLPYAMISLSTLLLLQSATHSYQFAGAVTGGQSLAVAAGGALVGWLADRIGPRTVGVAAAVSNVAAMCVLAASTHLGRVSMAVAAMVAGFTQPQIGPLMRVHWSHVLQGPRRAGLLPAAMAYETAADEASFVLGPLAVGALAGIATPVGRLGPLAGASVVLAGAATAVAMRYSGGGVQDRSRVRAPSRQPLPRGSMTLMFCAMTVASTVFGAVQVGLAVQADRTGHLAWAGTLYSMLGVGGLAAGLVFGKIASRIRPPRYLIISALGFVAGTAQLPLAGVGLCLPVPILLTGATIAPYTITLCILAQRLAPSGRRATVVSLLCAGDPIGTAIGQVLAGYIAEHVAEGDASTAAFCLAPAASTVALLLAACLNTTDRLHVRRCTLTGARPGRGSLTSTARM